MSRGREYSRYIPFHENIIQHFANIEFYDPDDSDLSDCLGWLTVMEKADGSLRTALELGTIDLEERKNIAIGIKRAVEYLGAVGISHYDLKLENVLLIGKVAKIADFGIISDKTNRLSYRKMGYARRGSKFRLAQSLYSGTPGFSDSMQIIGNPGYSVENIIRFIFCEWKTAWSLLFDPIDENEKALLDEILEECNLVKFDKAGKGCGIINHTKTFPSKAKLQEATAIACIPTSGEAYFNDPKLTKLREMSVMKEKIFRSHLDHPNGYLCVPISVATVICDALENDLEYQTDDSIFFKVFFILTMIICPRSLARFDLNPDSQDREIEKLLRRLKYPTYVNASGWEILRSCLKLPKSKFSFEKVAFDSCFRFTRPLTVTAAYSPESGATRFQQMVLDRIENNVYVLKSQSETTLIPTNRPVFSCEIDLKENEWYLLPQAFSVTIIV